MDILNRIKGFCKLILFDIRCIPQIEGHILSKVRYQELMERAITSTERGVSDVNLCNYEVVVSLTTHGRRFYNVAASIESIMRGTMKPNRIVLWIDEKQKQRTLPIVLERQMKRGLEIRYCKDVGPYTKLLPSLKAFPDSAIITIDDDVFYDYDLVENLVRGHLYNPEHVIAKRVHHVVLAHNSCPISYMNWKWCQDESRVSALNFATGVGGVLYPPNTFCEEVFNEDVFRVICKNADDVWFYAMELMCGKRVMKCETHSKEGEDYILNSDVQDIALVEMNANKRTGKCENDNYIKMVFDHYNLWDKLTECDG